MGLVLRWRRSEQSVALGSDGRLNYYCPFCGTATFLHPGDFKITENEVRTTGVVLCIQSGCDMLFEIAHSVFMVWQPRDSDRWLFYRRWYQPQKLRTVWRTYNERRRR